MEHSVTGDLQLQLLEKTPISNMTVFSSGSACRLGAWGIKAWQNTYTWYNKI